MHIYTNHANNNIINITNNNTGIYYINQYTTASLCYRKRIYYHTRDLF